MEKSLYMYLSHRYLNVLLAVCVFMLPTFTEASSSKEIALNNVNEFITKVSENNCNAASKHMRFPFWIDRLYIETARWTEMCKSISSKFTLLHVTDIYDSSNVNAKMLLQDMYMINDVDMKKALYVDAKNQTIKSGYGFIVDCSSGNCLIAGFDDSTLMISEPRRPEIEKAINGEYEPIVVNMDALSLTFSYPGFGWVSYPVNNIKTATNFQLVSGGKSKSFFISAKIDIKHSENFTDKDLKQFEKNTLSSTYSINSRARTTLGGHPAYKIKYVSKRKYSECLSFLLLKNGFHYTISGCAFTGKPIETDKEISHILNSVQWM